MRLNGSFIACANEEALGTTLSCEVPTSKWFSYEASAAATSSFVASASVTNAFGTAVAGNKATINQAGQKTAVATLSAYAPNWK
jgi:hypothetical protein